MIVSSWWRPLGHAEYRASWFPGLTGLRALAALAVVFFHYGGPVVDRLQGWIAVQLFFVLSGFLITTLALREEDRTGRISLRDFYVRRVFRIMPVYFLLLGSTALAVTLAGTYHASRLADAMPFYLTFFNEVVDYNTPYPTSWSLGVEEQFYLVWPALLVLTSFARSGKAALRLGFGAGVVVAVLTVLPLAPSAQWASLSVHYGSLVIGCLLGLALHHPRGFAVFRPLTSPAAAVLVARVRRAAAVGQAAGTAARRPLAVRRPDYAAGSALLLIAVTARGPVRRLLASRPFKFAGDRSYALYLAQTGAAGVTGLLLPTGLAKAAATSAVALLFACGLRRWVELPAIAYGRRLLPAKGERAPAEERQGPARVR